MEKEENKPVMETISGEILFPKEGIKEKEYYIVGKTGGSNKITLPFWLKHYYDLVNETRFSIKIMRTNEGVLMIIATLYTPDKVEVKED